jgi:superoxide dismutase, Fe-Mn family
MAKGAGGKPSGPLADEISKTFGDFTAFQQQLKQAAVSRFGSGWAWLVLDGGKLQILSTPKQDSPYMKNQAPIMGVDVWEHAYYLKYQNKRPDYVDAWWNVVNWKAIGDRYSKAKAGKL